MPRAPTTPERQAALHADPRDAALPLPHERDEAVGEVAQKVDPVMRQAKRDIDAGQVDTDMRATPGLDAAQRQRLVPTPTRPAGLAPEADAATGVPVDRRASAQVQKR
jgi:hypothetical protein